MKLRRINAKNLTRIAIAGIACIIAGISINFIVNPNFTSSTHDILFLICLSFVIGLPLWLINMGLNYQINKRIGWVKNPSKALRWHLSLTALINPVLLFGIITALFWNHNGSNFSFADSANSILAYTAAASLVGFLIWGFIALIEFFTAYKEGVLKQEQLKREAVLYQYEMLKAQVNPHFLFNSLNVLTSLVETDSEGAVKFIRKLAEVYRYVLDAKDKEKVPLSEELALVESYVYMQKIRFGESLNVAIEELPIGRKIIPLSLQMLVENAIKHNQVSLTAPLSIHIYATDEHIVCTNNCRPKAVIGQPNRIGLKNIRERYQMLAPVSMEYGIRDNCFVVKLPLL